MLLDWRAAQAWRTHAAAGSPDSHSLLLASHRCPPSELAALQGHGHSRPHLLKQAAPPPTPGLAFVCGCCFLA